MPVSQFTLDLALLSTYAYDDWSEGATALPLNGWEVVIRDEALFGSDSATVYRKGSDVVIAFRGTDGVGDIVPDLAFGYPNELLNPQYLAAVQTLMSVVTQPGDTLTLTGHSLGGGLAGLVAAHFNLPAIVFAPAPYGISLLDTPSEYAAAAQNVSVVRIEGEAMDYFPGFAYPANFTTKVTLRERTWYCGAVPLHDATPARTALRDGWKVPPRALAGGPTPDRRSHKSRSLIGNAWKCHGTGGPVPQPHSQ